MHPVFEQYEERLNRLNMKESTLRNYRRTATLFEEAGLDPGAVEDWQVEEWLAGLTKDDGEPLAPRTKRLHLENLKAIYKYAAHRGLVSVSPMDFVRIAREPDREPHTLTNDELRAVIRNASNDQELLLAHLLIYTGMRRNEVRQLEWADVKLPEQTITVRAGKGDKLRHIPIHPILGETLVECGSPRWDDYVISNGRGGQLADTSMFNRMEALRGDVECSYHDFRRTVATNLVEAEVPERIINKIMGWSPRIVLDKHYARVADAKLQQAIRTLYADDPL